MHILVEGNTNLLVNPYLGNQPIYRGSFTPFHCCVSTLFNPYESRKSIPINATIFEYHKKDWNSRWAKAQGSACSVQVAAAGLTLPAVLAARALVGFGEGVALPCMNNLVAVNVPPARRATALGTAFSGFHSGAPFPFPLQSSQSVIN